VKNPTEQICTQAFMDRRKNSLYDTDGIVIGVDQAPIYSPTPMKGPVQNPKDCVAFKMVVTDQSATTTVKDVVWTPSAQGYLIPRIKFEPVLIGGASIEYCSGHNARTIVDKVLGPGAVIQIRRSGDVIPTLDSVSIPALIASLPSPTIGWHWNGSPETATHICLTSVTSEQRISQLHHFAKTLEIQGLGPASCKALVDAGIDSPKGLWESTESKLSKTLGPKTGKTLYDALRSLPTNDKITEITLLLASNKIPRGTGEAKLNSLFKSIPDLSCLMNLNTIPSGWTEESFLEFQYSLSNYEEWRKTEVYWIPNRIPPKMVSKPTGLMNGTVCFTGFRDKILEESLVNLGFTIAPNMTSNVTILVTPDDLSKVSEKVKKARASNTVEVITRAQLMNKYLQ
jgi:NAD-dependent DNA ligase